MIDNITKFSSLMAISFAEEVDKKNSDEASVRAKDLIEYIEKKYEKAIKNAILHLKTARRADIPLPYFKRIHNDAVYGQVSRLVEKHFKELGFDITINRPNHCSCLFDILCNSKGFTATIRW